MREELVLFDHLLFVDRHSALYYKLFFAFLLGSDIDLYTAPYLSDM